MCFKKRKVLFWISSSWFVSIFSLCCVREKKERKGRRIGKKKLKKWKTEHLKIFITLIMFYSGTARPLLLPIQPLLHKSSYCKGELPAPLIRTSPYTAFLRLYTTSNFLQILTFGSDARHNIFSFNVRFTLGLWLKQSFGYNASASPYTTPLLFINLDLLFSWTSSV